MIHTRKILGVALVLTLVLAGVAHASEFVPNRTGDSSTFQNLRFGGTTTSSIDSTSGGWRHHTEFGGLGALWIWTSSSHEYVYLWSDALGTYQLLANFAGPVGQRNRVNASGCNNGDVVLAEKGVRVVTAAGTFDGCTRLDLTSSCADAGVMSIWFAPKIGIVRWEAQSIAGPVVHELSSGRIDGKTYPAPAGGGLSVTTSFPATLTYINRMPMIGGPRPVKKLPVSMTVKNDTGADVVFRFASGQKFDIVVVDQAGNVVSRWSRSQFFTQALSVITLRNGESRQFGGEVELTTDAGDPLPAGSYTLKIEVTSRADATSDHTPGSSRLSASSPLRIEWVY